MSAVPVDPRISVNQRLLVDVMPDRFHRAVEGEHAAQCIHQYVSGFSFCR
jgi:hypothetical protein